MQRTKTQTLIEAVVQTGVAFVLSVILQHFVVNPIWDLKQTFTGSLSMVLFFTAVSLVRGYTVGRGLNRMFVWLFHRSKAKEGLKHER